VVELQSDNVSHIDHGERLFEVGFADGIAVASLFHDQEGVIFLQKAG
jgi:hypothetical protein